LGPDRLTRTFFARPARIVARELLGQRLVRTARGGERLSGWVTETEAYVGPEDLACHASAGRTRRNGSLWKAPGHAYVYFTYGVHWLFNVAVEREGFPAAVLIRALSPAEGTETMSRRRPRAKSVAALADGPAKLCQAMDIEGAFDGIDLCTSGSHLVFEEDRRVPDEAVSEGPRVGLGRTPEPWKSAPYRYSVRKDVLRSFFVGRPAFVREGAPDRLPAACGKKTQRFGTLGRELNGLERRK
jgi:DNA-3-methyladenine glycosylase